MLKKYQIIIDICNRIGYYKLGDKLKCKFAVMLRCNAKILWSGEIFRLHN